MFDRQDEHYAVDPKEANLGRLNPGVQTFWGNQAAAVLGVLGGAEDERWHRPAATQLAPRDSRRS